MVATNAERQAAFALRERIARDYQLRGAMVMAARGGEAWVDGLTEDALRDLFAALLVDGREFAKRCTDDDPLEDPFRD